MWLFTCWTTLLELVHVLFQELHYTAFEKKELSLAELAMKKAELLKQGGLILLK